MKTLKTLRFAVLFAVIITALGILTSAPDAFFVCSWLLVGALSAFGYLMSINPCLASKVLHPQDAEAWVGLCSMAILSVVMGGVLGWMLLPCNLLHGVSRITMAT